MNTVFDLLAKGGPLMIPIIGLSVVTLAYGLDRGVFWFRVFRRKTRIAHDVLKAARYNLREAESVAEQAQDLAIGRFLLAPLRLQNPSPETFHLALEAVADQEFADMRRGDRLLETTLYLAPLLGLLGTAIGLMVTLFTLKIEAGQKVDLSAVATRVGETLIPTASGILVAIIALIFYRIAVTLQGRQMDYFSQVGSELELIYRQIWYEPQHHALGVSVGPEHPLSRQEL